MFRAAILPPELFFLWWCIWVEKKKNHEGAGALCQSNAPVSSCASTCTGCCMCTAVKARVQIMRTCACMCMRVEFQVTLAYVVLYMFVRGCTYSERECEHTCGDCPLTHSDKQGLEVVRLLYVPASRVKSSHAGKRNNAWIWLMFWVESMEKGFFLSPHSEGRRCLCARVRPLTRYYNPHE